MGNDDLDVLHVGHCRGDDHRRHRVYPRATARLTASCDTRDATEIPSDRAGLRRLEQVTQVHPQYVGTRYYVFDGGCLAMVFRLAGDYRAEPLAVATESIDVVGRADVAAHVHEESGGRLQLDGPAAEDGTP